MTACRKDDVLAAMGHVPDLASLIPAAFRERFHLAEPAQYGMVCRDVADRVAALEALGAGPFVHATTRPPGWTEHGVPRMVRAEVALGYCAGQQIELLGPGENTDLYTEKIPPDGSIALHHVGIAQLGLDESVRAFEAAGFENRVAMHFAIGPLYSIDVRYYDTRDELGFYVELIEFRTFGRHTPFTERMISRLARIQRRFASAGR